MTTHIPREAYSSEELARLYPKELELQLVQILLRHGERSPVSPRFQNAGLRPYWPYCKAATQLTGVIMATTDWSNWDQLKYRRRLETFGMDDGPVIASGPKGEFDAVCSLTTTLVEKGHDARAGSELSAIFLPAKGEFAEFTRQPGELTDKGRETTLALGQRLRNLYVDLLRFMPALISDSDMIYLRATPIPRALESVQQAFYGFYPPTSRTADFPTPTIITRTPADETLFPNDSNCRRFAHLSRAFAQRTADRWNDTDDMRYLSSLWSKWMPNNAAVAVDSHPRVSGIMDTVNSTDAHGPLTKLPTEFYDPRARQIIDKVSVEEWFSGYKESDEYRMLGIGALLGDITARMAGSVERNGSDGLLEIGGVDGHLGRGRGGEQDIKLALSGCHDTTLAAALTSLGAYDVEHWPPFTSHIAFELFRKKAVSPQPSAQPVQRSASDEQIKTRDNVTATTQGWWAALFGKAKTAATQDSAPAAVPKGIGRKPLTQLTPQQREELREYYVRIRFNDRVMQVPGCKPAGKHLDGDASFCTLEAFKSIVDQYTPKNWKQACAAPLEAPAFPAQVEPAGYE
ncbi:histidine phosphatase superfamily [Massariosphaeria phaeospora]|uniref:3-phytase n=1 Tax=Massariosphaeria phaeospora TaxID=100035 RepID=A0A7C8I0Z2_9PLEO|nr:histidine phosphatase superfamily [Massariosphaeria phaeospora]